MEVSLTRFPQKRAFVTGAGSGLGRAFCLCLARQGWTLGIQDIQAASAQETLLQVEKEGGKGTVFVCDAADRLALQGAVRAFASAQSGLDLLINNAGVGVGGNVGELPPEDWDWIVGINLMGPVYGCEVAVPIMRAQRSGHILNVASLAGLIAAPGLAPYNATKSAVVALTETLRVELARSGVSTSVLCPSFFKTNIVKSARAANAPLNSLAEKLMERSKYTAEDIATIALLGVQRDDLYVLPHLEGRVLWRLKRMAPGAFAAFMRRYFNFKELSSRA